MLLTRRTQILLDEDRYERLQRHSEAAGASIAALIRDAIDQAYPAVPTERSRAAASFLRATRANQIETGEQEDWSSLKTRARDEIAELDRYRP